MDGERGENTLQSISRRRPNFSTCTPEEDDARLAPTDSSTATETTRLLDWWPTLPVRSYNTSNPTENLPEPRARSSHSGVFDGLWGWWNRFYNHGAQGLPRGRILPDMPITAGPSPESSVDRNGSNRQRYSTSDNSGKLGTFSGVFVPTSLNVLSILMFLRFGFILGQAGLLGMIGLLAASYMINLVTTMSLSAIATNGTVKGGGAYYLISRSLGPEFGGSIGIVFYLGYVLNTGMNAVGLVDCFKQNFGTESGTWANFLEEGFWWQYLWGTIILILCTGICLAGSSIFSRASNGLLVIVLVATLSIPVSAIAMKPFIIPKLGVNFTGLRLQTFLENLKPHLTKGADGSQLTGRENFQDLFGILFPATGGIFAGASMSGDLRNPSKSIPKGTLYGLALTFVTYTLVIFAMSASITRESFYQNANIVQIVNLSGAVILLGELATTFFSALMGVIGSAKLLQAIAKDSLLPGLTLFGKGTKTNDEPVNAIIVTFIVAQFTMLFDINQIASFITMIYLMTFLVMNLACFLLKIGSAPNFRPSFHYFNWQTAAAGTLVCGASMFFVDGVYATSCFGMLIILFLLIHYTSPPKPWGDVSQSLIYHQVRKYLLRLKQEHVKFWRPQILLFVNDLDDQYKMVSFCNSLKKGALFILGHVLVTNDFSTAVPEARRQQITWTKIVESSKVKAFINITVSPSVEWGIRNVVLNSGLGGMRPNIVIIDQFREGYSLAETIDSHIRSAHQGRTDTCNFEANGPPTTCKTYVTVLEDLLFKLRINVAVAKGFEDLCLPGEHGVDGKKYIDLWPIQMSADLGADGEIKRNVLTTNFDTYTLILQLGCILNTVPSWKKAYRLRVAVFVEYETEVEEERKRVETLLEKLRIEAEVLVFWLACGYLKTYRIIVNGDLSSDTHEVQDAIFTALEGEDWWQDIQLVRKRSEQSPTINLPKLTGQRFETAPAHLNSPNQEQGQASRNPFAGGLKRFVQSSKRRRSISSLTGFGQVNLGMQTHRLLDAFVEDDSTASEMSDNSELDNYVSNENKGVKSTHNESLGQPNAYQGGGASYTARYAVPEDNGTGQIIPSIATTDETGSPRSQASAIHPSLTRPPSSNRFSSSPIPEARVNPDEGAGPSIMFESSSSAPRSSSKSRPVYKDGPTINTSGIGAASGYPQQASVPLCFNDLPSRAQHLILNELMGRHSSDTAVIFTTLPSPLEGTAARESTSRSYLSDLGILWQGLPPCLLVHSNSMTVTLNI